MEPVQRAAGIAGLQITIERSENGSAENAAQCNQVQATRLWEIVLKAAATHGIYIKII
jgi:hypothetical protein